MSETVVNLFEPIGTDHRTRLPRSQVPGEFWKWWRYFSSIHLEASIDDAWDAWAAGAVAAANWANEHGVESKRDLDRKIKMFRDLLRKRGGFGY